jgi:hypothetical protein
MLDKLSRPTFTSVVYDPMRGTLTGHVGAERRITLTLTGEQRRFFAMRRRQCDLDTMAMLVDEMEPREEEQPASGVQVRTEPLTYQEAVDGLKVAEQLVAKFKARVAS